MWMWVESVKNVENIEPLIAHLLIWNQNLHLIGSLYSLLLQMSKEWSSLECAYSLPCY